MAARIVKRAVHVRNTKTGQEGWLVPGDKVPDWAEGLITNLNVFKDPEDRTSAKFRNDTAKVALEDAPAKEEAEEDPFAEDVDWMALTHEDLNKHLEERNLSTGGTKPEKVARIEAHDASQS